jgi:hypothetical protein
MSEQLATWYRRNGRPVLRHWLSQPDPDGWPKLWRGRCGIRHIEHVNPQTGESSLIADLTVPICATCATLHPQEEINHG